jgi:hypothetical protein
VFVRRKAKDGQEPARHVQKDFEARLPVAEQADIERSVKRGMNDIEAGRSENCDAEGLRGLA